MRTSAKNRGLIRVARQLFTDEVHETLVDFVDERAQFLPLRHDGEIFSRLMAHNVGIFRHLHNQLTDFASEHFGEKLKPSYSFLSMYDDNGIFPLHIDRDQCRYTVDYLIRQDHPEPWPIYVSEPISDEERTAATESGSAHPEDEYQIARIKRAHTFAKVELRPNDAVLYSGTHQWHYRDRIQSTAADLAFFHFVAEGFNGPLD